MEVRDGRFGNVPAALAVGVFLLFAFTLEAQHEGYRASGLKRCKFIKLQPSERRYARTVAQLDVGKPRTVRTIYFVPNDRHFRADELLRIKDEILRVQQFFLEQMREHATRGMTYRFETDAKGSPRVHRVKAQHAESHYENNAFDTVQHELAQQFDLDKNIYVIIIDSSTESVDGAAGLAVRWGKINGYAIMPTGFTWATLAHELGHTFGLEHDFRDNAYVMSYGPFEDRLSQCSADYLAVHPYFDREVSIEESTPPTMEIVSPTRYPEGAANVLIKLKLSASRGLHQVFLMVDTRQPHYAVGGLEVKTCRAFAGETTASVTFDYDGVIPSIAELIEFEEEMTYGEGYFEPIVETSLSNPIAHPMTVVAVDTDGNEDYTRFSLSRTSPHHIITLEGHEGDVRSVRFSPDGTSVASASLDGTIKLWDVVLGENTATFEGHTDAVNSIAYSPDGRTLVSGSWDGTIKLWAVKNGDTITTLEAHPEGVDSVAYSPDGRTSASGSWDGTIKLWDANNGNAIATLEEHTSPVTSVSFSSDGRTLASGSWDGTIKLSDVKSGENIAFERHASAVNAVTFSPDDRVLAVGLWNGSINLSSPANGETIDTFEHGSGVNDVAFSPGGSTLASGSMEGTVKLWDVVNRAIIDTFGHQAGVNSVAFSPSGDTLALGFDAGVVELWDTSWLSGHEQPQPPDYPPVDVNADGVVNILDLVMVAAVLGEQGIGWREDVNGDEVVDILDLVAVAAAMND